MQFSRELRPRVAAGEITVSVRLWARPQVRPGGTHVVPGTGVTIQIDDVDLLPFHAITDDDVRASGEPDRESLRTRAAHAGPIANDTLVHRISFHVVPTP